MSHFGCRCAADSPPSSTIHSLASSTREGQAYQSMGFLPGDFRRPFCASKEDMVCSLEALTTPPPPPPPRLTPSSSFAPSVAWVITGNLRTFFSPLVHDSLLHNGILALGGSPRLFFSAASDDEIKPGMTTHDVAAASSRSGTLGTARGRPCTSRYRNLSHFLSDNPAWAALTASVSESTGARPPPEDTLANPRCDLAEIGWSMHPRDYAQLWRWHEAFAAVRREENERARRFSHVARLRFDVAIAAPLPADLLASPSTAYASWPCWYKPRARLLPLPDHLFVVPRAHASAAFDIFERLRSCQSGTFEASLRLRSRVAKNASSTLRDGPPLCCGYGPTGLLVRALQLRAEHEPPSLGSHGTATRARTARGSHAGSGPDSHLDSHEVGGGGGAARAWPPLRFALLEWPIFVVGKPPAQYCRTRHQSTVIGYFGRRGSKPPDGAAAQLECSRVLRACEHWADDDPERIVSSASRMRSPLVASRTT